MPRRWLGFPIDPGKVRAAAFMMLYSRKSAALALDAYAAADRGDASGLAALSLAMTLHRTFLGDGPLGDLYCKGSLDYDPGRDYVADSAPAGHALGAPISEMIWGPLAEGCPWPRVPADARLGRLRPTDVETLLLGGTLDVATPVQAATRDALPFLRRGQQIVLPGMSHLDLLQERPEAFQALAVRFFDTGAGDLSGFLGGRPRPAPGPAPAHPGQAGPGGGSPFPGGGGGPGGLDRAAPGPGPAPAEKRLGSASRQRSASTSSPCSMSLAMNRCSSSWPRMPRRWRRRIRPRTRVRVWRVSRG